MGKKILLLFMMVWLSVGVNAHKGSCDATWLGESKTCPPDLYIFAMLESHQTENNNPFYII